VIYTYAAVALVSAVMAGTAAWKVQAWRFDSAKLEAIEDAHEREKMRRQAANAGAQAHEGDKTIIQTKFIPITTEVERVVTQIEYRDRACFADDGVRILNSAIAATGDRAIPGNPVPATSAAR
jgi:hypothetical protein